MHLHINCMKLIFLLYSNLQYILKFWLVHQNVASFPLCKKERTFFIIINIHAG